MGHVDSEGFGIAAPLPAHYANPNAQLGNGLRTDNTPAGNPVTNAGAALGQVLFYDRNLLANTAIDCARGRFFWDERAATLEARVLEPN